MKCLVYFLSDICQKRLRRIAQSQSVNYEEALDRYRDMFLSQLNCSIRYSNECTDCNLNCNKGCIGLRNILEKIDYKQVYDFFNEIKSIYISWIDAKWSESLNLFTDLMKKYEMLNGLEYNEIQQSILYRGRISEDILTPWDMYHIPFNKRYLVRNQRYSLTGQPMIYLGSSLIDLVEELEIKEDDLVNFKVSTYKIKKNIKLYDLRNNIYQDINSNNDDRNILKLSSINLFDKSRFFRNLLSSVCSFEKRKEYKDFSFCEEYVIPQILAKTLKKESFDGIAYYSTKKFQNINFKRDNIDTDDIKFNKITKVKYKENIALFTNFTLDHVYDRDLFKEIDISVPIDINKIEDIGIEELSFICDEIGKMGIQKMITESSLIYSSFDREFSECYIDDTKYYETSIGKLHIYHLYIILNNILARCKEEVS